MDKISSNNMPKKIVWVLLLMALTLFSCAKPARYVFITDNKADVQYDNFSQRYICLSESDSKTYNEILALRTKSDIEKYKLKRSNIAVPGEEVLFHLITEDYKKAEELLNANQNVIPEYLKLMMRADLAAEIGEGGMQSKQLINLYQEALDMQPCKISGDLIKFRIRQWRYER